MAVERNENGSVTIRSNNGVMVVGGMVKVSDDKNEDNFKRWLVDSAKLVTACAHTLKETEQYFLVQCDALPLASDDRRMKNFQLNVVMNYCEEKLEHQPSKFSFDMTDEEIEKWKKEQDVMREEALNSSPERFGLVMRGYYLPHTERNVFFYEQARKMQEKGIRLAEQKRAERTGDSPRPAAQMVPQDICVFFEETTEHCQSTGGGDHLIQELIDFKGVTEGDIEKRSPRFLGYIFALREMGKLPDFQKE